MTTVLNLCDHRKIQFTIEVDSALVTVASYASFYRLCSREGIPWNDIEITPNMDRAKISVRICGDLIEQKNKVMRLLHEAKILTTPAPHTPITNLQEG